MSEEPIYPTIKPAGPASATEWRCAAHGKLICVKLADDRPVIYHWREAGAHRDRYGRECRGETFLRVTRAALSAEEMHAELAEFERRFQS